MGLGHLEHGALVRDVGVMMRTSTPRFGGVAQGRVGGHVHDQIGRGDIDIVPGREIMFRYTACPTFSWSRGVSV